MEKFKDITQLSLLPSQPIYPIWILSTKKILAKKTFFSKMRRGDDDDDEEKEKLDSLLRFSW